MIVCVLIFVEIFIFINNKATENNSLVNSANVEQYFSEVNIPNLKYSNDKLTYNGNLVKGFFDPIEVAKRMVDMLVLFIQIMIMVMEYF